ncbi:hypothetical protein OG339_17085 [Streptosporangium sp. NBC_01495]|uniref:nSTAND1 domain-containing NTPase n=1 Tax=Streptosporangium sp. NBC_01495 TaxID=2903899 RepID=UPI002E36408D|nr:hypothetical protein [Streptosporangium sp. NBC_01495]
MSRREVPVDPAAGPVQRFAYELRKLRQEAGPVTYREMARRVDYSVTTLSQAAAGERLASLPVVLAYVRACGADPAEWEARWRKTAGEVVAEAVSDDVTDAPYLGLASYQARDGDRFFGRDRLVAELLELVGRHRFTGLFGPSGSGKSSLLRAGLVPALRLPSGGGNTGIQVLTPGDRPLTTHRDRLLACGNGSEADGADPETGETDSGTGGDGPRTLVVVDQFEELYTLCGDQDERAGFIDLLLASRRPGSRFRVVVAVRADFYGRCAEHRELTLALRDATLLIGPMSRQELREAIVKPATGAGLIVERELSARIVEEVADEPGGLPLMSHALLETWRRRRGRALTLAGYEAAGGVSGAIAHTAEKVYTRLSPAQAVHARRVLLRLVNPDGEGRHTRRPAVRAELDPGGSADTALVLEQLAQARMITLYEDTVEIAHEALIASWPRLREWIDGERERLRLQRDLTEAARTWEELGRDPGALYRGTRLATAGALLTRQEDLTVPERAFLTASNRAASRAEHAASRRRRLARVAVAALAVLTVIASAAALTAVEAAGRADAREKEALSRLVTIHSEGLADTDPVLSGLLAAAAWRFLPTDEARYGMVTALATSVKGVLNGHTASVTAVAFSPDGRTLATAGQDRSARLWDVATRRPIGAPLTGHDGWITAVAFSPDGKTLATAGGDGTARLWNLATRRPIGDPLTSRTGRPGLLTTVAFSPDGRTLATAGVNDAIRLWDVATRRPAGLSPTGHGDWTNALAFSPDGRTLATAGGDGTARLWNLATRRPIGDPLTGHGERINAVAFSPDGRRLATVGGDGTARLWDAGTRRPAGPPITGHPGALIAVAFSPDGTLLATAGGDGTARLWDAGTRRPVGPPLTGHTATVTALAFSPDGTTLATAGGDGTARLWDIVVRRPVGPPLTGHTATVTALAFSPDGGLLASAGGDGTIRLWEAAAHRPAGRPLTGHNGPVTALAFTPDGGGLATVSGDGTVRLWNTVGRAPAGISFAGYVGIAEGVAFAPDGRTLATTGDDGTTRLWDVITRRPIGPPLTGHTGPVTSAAFSPDGRILATAGDDGTARLWDVATRRPIGAPLTGHTGSVTALAFNPHGHALATTGDDGSVRQWKVDMPLDPLSSICAVAGRSLTPVEWQRYVPGQTFQKTCP